MPEDGSPRKVKGPELDDSIGKGFVGLMAISMLMNPGAMFSAMSNTIAPGSGFDANALNSGAGRMLDRQRRGGKDSREFRCNIDLARRLRDAGHAILGVDLGAKGRAGVRQDHQQLAAASGADPGHLVGAGEKPVAAVVGACGRL